MTKQKTLRKRKWLNPPTSDDTGAMMVGGSYDDWSIDAYATIWDCSRKIEITFAVYEPKEYNKRIKKIKDMIAMLEDVEDFMEDVHDDWEDMYKERKRKDAERKKQDAAI